MLDSILWSCICRNDIILAEAGEDSFDGSVVRTAQALLKKKPTPGWEYHRGPNVRGVKFHVHERDSDSGEQRVWAYCCVYAEGTLERDQAQSFLEKMVYLTEYLRSEDELWRHGDRLAAQESFAPILLQRMQEVGYLGRVAMVSQDVDSAKELMAKNIDMILERGERLEDLDEKATAMEKMSRQFKKRTKQVKRFQMWQNAKHGMMVGGLVTTGVAVVVVPPLIALL